MDHVLLSFDVGGYCNTTLLLQADHNIPICPIQRFSDQFRTYSSPRYTPWHCQKIPYEVCLESRCDQTRSSTCATAGLHLPSTRSNPVVIASCTMMAWTPFFIHSLCLAVHIKPHHICLQCKIIGMVFSIREGLANIGLDVISIRIADLSDRVDATSM